MEINAFAFVKASVLKRVIRLRELTHFPFLLIGTLHGLVPFLAASSAFAIIGRFRWTIFYHVTLFLAIPTFVVVFPRRFRRTVFHHVTFLFTVAALVIVVRFVGTIAGEMTLLKAKEGVS